METLWSGVFKRHGIPVAIAVLILIAAGVLGIQRAGLSNPSLVHPRITFICVDPECGRTFSIRLRAGSQPKCPDCGGPAVPAFTCPGCRRPVVLNGYVGRQEPTICPHCKQEVHYEE